MSQYIGKDPDVGKEEKGEIEDEMVGWHHRFSGHESEQALGGREGQGSLAVAHGVTESNITEPPNNNGKLTAYTMEHPVSHLTAPEAHELTWTRGRQGIINITEPRPVDEIT